MPFIFEDIICGPVIQDGHCVLTPANLGEILQQSGFVGTASDPP